MNELPYIKQIPKDGRATVITQYFDSKQMQWYAFCAQPNNQYLVLKIINLVEGIYIAKEPVDKALDCLLPLTEAAIQYFSFPDIMRFIMDLESDLLNGLASIEKYFILLDFCNSHKEHTSIQLINTELEYSFANYRAFYDRIQKIVSEVYRIYHPNHPHFPDSFRKMVAISVEDLRDKYSLTKPLIEFYKNHEHIFMTLRNIRDNIFHHGHSLDCNFHFEDGFAISVSNIFAKKLDGLILWPEHLLKPNKLGSLLAVFEFLVRDMFKTMDQLGICLVKSFQKLPEPMITEFHVYLRSRLTRHIQQLDRYKDMHWMNPKEALGIAVSTHM
ncbi:MAG TPA: hypothetical protein ACFYEK_05760 [Candidatus Wunengus sp. YC60]|uniref:hypothetical protein n=1 Tax=Candidatus Wunengus sp. YC60 TaxID=3367697 RepID=UPI004029BEE8